LTSLWQGVFVFDADQRLVTCNEAYLRMYGLSRDQAKPGTTLHEILQERIAKGLYSGASPEDYIRERCEAAGSGKPAIHTHTFSDGRVIRLGHHPISGGGWVATHDDITEQQILSARLKQQNELLKEQEQQLRMQNVHLDAALNNMSQGLILFDKDRRVVMCNRRYMEIYGLSSEQVQPGTPISHLIQHRLARVSRYILSMVTTCARASRARWRLPTHFMNSAMAARSPTPFARCPTAGAWRRMRTSPSSGV
jgi:PAS domain-containing protein